MTFEHDLSLYLFDKGIIQFGEFTLASGKTSPYYVDVRKILGHPEEHSRVIRALATAIRTTSGWQAPAGLVGVPTGGLAIAAALAYATRMPLAYVRKEAKSYGTGKRVEGMEFVEGSTRVLLIEDVVTTGGSVADAIAPLRAAGAQVTDAFTVIDRMGGGTERLAAEGVTLHSLLTIADIVDCLHEEGMISAETVSAVLATTTTAAPEPAPG
jgi:orotate phosphoribosyltransferase